MRLRINMKLKLLSLGVGAVILAAGVYWWKAVKPYILVEDALVMASQQILYAKTNGVVKKMESFPGKKISKNEVLFTIFHEEIQQEIDQIDQNIEKETKNLSAIKKDLDEGMKKYIEANAHSNGIMETALLAIQEVQVEIQSIESKIEQMKDAKQVLLHQIKSEIVPSFDGIVLEQLKKEGDLVKKGEPLFVMSKPSSFYIEATIPVKLLSKIKVNLPATICFPSYCTQKWNGKVASVGPIVQKDTVQIRIEAEDLPLYPGLQGNLKIRVD